jgi:hypothetical protein
MFVRKVLAISLTAATGSYSARILAAATFGPGAFRDSN